LDVAAAGGEEQLRGTEIEQAFDTAFSQVRRCLVLAASDEPVHGKLIFGLRIANDGRVAGVNLSGPSALTQGDAGACLRSAASSMHFRAFQGPDMVVRYPLTLD
jgi:ribonuclease I